MTRQPLKTAFTCAYTYSKEQLGEINYCVVRQLEQWGNNIGWVH